MYIRCRNPHTAHIDPTMPDIDTTKSGLGDINFETLPEHTRHRVLELIASESQDSRLGSGDVRHRSTASSDYDMQPPSPSNTPSWTPMDSFDPPPTLHTNAFQPYPILQEMASSPVLGLVTRPTMLSRPPRPAPLTRPPGTPIVWATDPALTQGLYPTTAYLSPHPIP